MIGEGTALLETEQGFPIPVLVSLSLSITVLFTIVPLAPAALESYVYRPVPCPDSLL